MVDAKKYKLVVFRKEVYDRLVEDKNHLKKTVGGKWSFCDVVEEYQKTTKWIKKKK